MFCEGPLAQLVEQETLNLFVVGSTPTRPTISLLNISKLDGAVPAARRFDAATRGYDRCASTPAATLAIRNCRTWHAACEAGDRGSVLFRIAARVGTGNAGRLQKKLLMFGERVTADQAQKLALLIKRIADAQLES